MSFYNEIEARVPNRSNFNLQHTNSTALQFNKLYPVLCEEVLPNDTFRLKTKALARFAPMVAPSFGNLKMYEHRFFVPRRIIDPYWKNFWTERKDGARAISLRTWYANANVYYRTTQGIQATENLQLSDYIANCQVFSKDASLLGVDSLADYLGITPLPLGEVTGQEIDLTPFIAYQYIYNEYYRDSTIEDDLFGTPRRHLWWLTAEGFPEFLNEFNSGGIFAKMAYVYVLEDGTQTRQAIPKTLIERGFLPFTTFDRAYSETLGATAANIALFEEIIHDLFHLRTRAWYRDYFTSARPSVTNGEIPIVPVQFNDINAPVSSSSSQGYVSRLVHPGEPYVYTNSTPSGNVSSATSTDRTLSNAGQYLFTKLGFTISALRLANAIQRKEEKIMLFGKRYIEQLASRFGVISSDASLQRPQYFGGNQEAVYMNEISQTSATTGVSAQGNYAGQAMIAGESDSDDFFSEEHGWILSLVSVLSEPKYGQGLHRKFTRNTNALNFYDPQFAGLTDQEIKEKELYCLTNQEQNYYTTLSSTVNIHPVALPDDTFGYQGRWDEYRQSLNRYSGSMRDELRYWHFGRKFASMRDYAFNAVYLTNSAYQVDSTFITKDLDALDDPTAFVLLFTCGQPTSGKNDVPVNWFNKGYIESLSAADQSSFYAGTLTLGCKIKIETFDAMVDSSNVNSVAGAILDSLVTPPKLLPSFIHSNVVTAPFAETVEFENIRPTDTYYAGDDYIFADFNFENSAVRAMPEQAQPTL